MDKTPKKSSKYVRVGENLQRYTPSGTYFARIRVGGQLHMKSLETDVLTTAKLKLRDFEKELKKKLEKEREGQKAISSLTVGEALNMLTQERKTDTGIKESTVKYYSEIIHMIKKTWPELADRDVRKVSEAECRTWAKRLWDEGSKFQSKGTKKPREGISSGRFNNAVSTLRQAFAIAVEAGLRSTNPVAKIRRTNAPAKPIHLPSRAEFKAILENMRSAKGRFSRACSDLAAFLGYSGTRIGEARKVTFQDIDFSRETITIRGHERTGTKNWSHRTMPMPTPLIELLTKIKADRPEAKPSSRILLVNECAGALERACRELDLPKITAHGFRHLFITTALESGIDVPTIAYWVGHKDGQLILSRYSHVRAAHGAAAMKKMNYD